MKAEKEFPIYSMDYFVENFQEILGIKDGEQVNILTPQFKREYELEISWKPETVAEFVALKTLPKEILHKMGVRVFDKENGEAHYLYPGEWFNIIPEGLSVVCIDGEKESFSQSTCDDDIRFGCIAYGFKRKEQEEQL